MGLYHRGNCGILLDIMPRYTVASEDILLERGAIPQRSLTNQEVIGCIGCRWLKAEQAGQEPKVHGFEIMKCIEAKSAGIVYRCLRVLEEAGALETEYEDPDQKNSRGPLQK